MGSPVEGPVDQEMSMSNNTHIQIELLKKMLCSSKKTNISENGVKIFSPELIGLVQFMTSRKVRFLKELC